MTIHSNWHHCCPSVFRSFRSTDSFRYLYFNVKIFLFVRQIIPLRVALWLCQKLPKYGEASRAYDRSYLSYTLHVPTTTTYMYLLPTTHCTFSFAKLVNFPGMSTVSKQKNIVFETRPWQDRRRKWVCGRGGVVSFCPTSSSHLTPGWNCREKMPYVLVRESYVQGR